MAYLTDPQKRVTLVKLKQYCSAHPRSHQDIKNRLYGMGVWRRDVEALLCELIEGRYVNETQLAQDLVQEKAGGGKWGRQKIRSLLVRRNVSTPNIQSAMTTIDAESYREALYEQAAAKWQSIRGVGVNRFVKLRKTRDFLLQRGYEPALIYEALNKLQTGQI